VVKSSLIVGLDNRRVARAGEDGDIEAAREYELPLHQLGSGSGSDDDDGNEVGVVRRSSNGSLDIMDRDLNSGRRLV
jgi:hypothetical protein